MQRILIIFLLAAVSLCLSFVSAFAQTQKADRRPPDSEYVEREPKPERDGGGLFDFLPFVGRRSKNVPPEDLAPSPLPKESKPVLSNEELGELRLVADRWLLTSDFTQPTVRQDEENRFYRDYIVFAGEYRLEVVRGDTEERPFVAYVYVKGDYFNTDPHDERHVAESDFDFKYEPLEFRLIFERVEEWKYSENPNEEPFTFTEQWQFRRLQSRVKVDLPEGAGASGETPAGEGGVETPEPAGD